MNEINNFVYDLILFTGARPYTVFGVGMIAMTFILFLGCMCRTSTPTKVKTEEPQSKEEESVVPKEEVKTVKRKKPKKDDE